MGHVSWDIAFNARQQLQTIKHSHGGETPAVVSDVYWDGPPNPDNDFYIYIYNNNKLVVRSLLFAPFIKQLPLVLVLSLLILGSMCRAIGVGIGLSCNFLATHADY